VLRVHVILELSTGIRSDSREKMWVILGMGKLSETGVKAASQPGRIGDGDGLFLIVQAGGTKS